MPTAVQHERGPRKPKLHPGSLMGHPSMNHHSSHIQSKDSLKLSPPGHSKFQLQVSPSSVFTPLSLCGSSGSSSGAARSPLSSGLEPPPPPPPPPPFFQPPGGLAPPPGLLHILMSAEKCQVIHYLINYIVQSNWRDCVIIHD